MRKVRVKYSGLLRASKSDSKDSQNAVTIRKGLCRVLRLICGPLEHEVNVSLGAHGSMKMGMPTEMTGGAYEVEPIPMQKPRRCEFPPFEVGDVTEFLVDILQLMHSQYYTSICNFSLSKKNRKKVEITKYKLPFTPPPARTHPCAMNLRTATTEASEYVVFLSFSGTELASSPHKGREPTRRIGICT
ncbi:hypothetical protein ACFE04_021523 [Oxalis oulophora]